MMCVDCERFSLKDRPEMARTGFGTCAMRSRFIVYAALRDHDCGQYSEAPHDIRDARRKWLQQGAENGKSTRD